ncbi:hypothetical protein [Lutibacter citreus]|uniref:hypothetical protein n=1 Tax=Lutibacter citreus TaxID=2138210 RepID=UPI000DBE7A60|nr:hypothetical protein [Lutibacter citreus]
MNTIENIIAIPRKSFTVTTNDINNNNALLSNILYNKMEGFSKDIVLNKSNIDFPNPRLYKLELLKNAYLNDTLHLKSKIKKYNETELQLLVAVEIENNIKDNIICKAIFKFPLKNKIQEAS